MLKVTHPVPVGDKLFFSIYDGKGPYMYQTRDLYIKYIDKYDSGYARIELISQDPKIHEIETTVCSKIQRVYPHYATNFESSKEVLKVNAARRECVEVFDMGRARLDWTKLAIGERVRVLICVDKYVWGPTRSYVNYTLVQVCLFRMTIAMPPPPPPPPPPPVFKTFTIVKKDPVPKKKADSSRKVPTLEEIQTALKNLRKKKDAEENQCVDQYS